VHNHNSTHTHIHTHTQSAGNVIATEGHRRDERRKGNTKLSVITNAENDRFSGRRNALPDVFAVHTAFARFGDGAT
jgi:hypothetical protein